LLNPHRILPNGCPQIPTRKLSPAIICNPQLLIESYSHYFNESTASQVSSDAYNLGVKDAQLESPHCTSTASGGALAILDFGQPAYEATNIYGVYDYNYGIFLTYSQVSQATQQYIYGWQHAAASCLALAVVMGANSNTICPYDRANWCYYWNGYVLEQTAATLNGEYANAGIGIVGGSDIEMDAGQGYDPYSIVSQWLTGYFKGGSDLMYDYGDACQDPGAGCTTGWTSCDIYQAAWGYGYDEPVPEIYLSGQAQDWKNVQNIEGTCSPNAGAMQFSGIANESWGSHLSWQIAWSTFLSTMGSGTVATKQDTCFPYVNTSPLSSECY
jgi:hypothetical protein